MTILHRIRIRGFMKKNVFRMPTPVKITGRTSSITNAFVNGIIPVVEPTEAEIDDALATLGMTRESICCAYCGDTCTEWDHFRPLIVDKGPTGYISEIHNLVPSCGKCNQSKGNKEWKKWMYSDASLSPKTRGITDINERCRKLEVYERKYAPTKLDFVEIVGEELWEKHWNNHEKLLELMKTCQETSDEIQERITMSLRNE